MLLRALGAIALAVGAMGFVRSPWELLALRLCQGIFSGFVPPSMTLVSVAAPASIQGRVSGGLASSLALGSVLGPIFGALVQENFGLRSVFFCVSVLAGSSALLVALLAHEERELGQAVMRWSPTAVLADTWRDLRVVLGKGAVRDALFVLFLVQLGLGATNPQMELLVGDVWDGEPDRLARLTALAVSAFAAAGLVGMPAWGRIGDRIGHARALSMCAVLGALALGMHAGLMTFAALVAGRLVLGLTIAGTTSNSFGVVATQTPTEHRGSAMGIAFSARAFAMSMGAMGGGVMAGLVGLRGLFIASGALVLGGLLLIRCRPRHHKI
jgi:DHA1 family multidrug resistance protein-like MFS transporter